MSWWLEILVGLLTCVVAVATIGGVFAKIFFYVQRSELSKKFEEYGFSKLKDDVGHFGNTM